MSRAAHCALVLAAATATATPPAAQELRPEGLVALPDEPGQRVVLVEKSTQSLGVWESGPDGPRLEKSLPCTTGRADGDKLVEGDLRTPLGVYWFTRYIPGDELPPLYGAGALVMDYPNVFDVRAGKTGSGIWLHGVEEDDRVLVARDTRGCVAVRNDHFEELRRVLGLRDTPILVVETVALAPVDRLEAEAAAVRRQLEDWRQAWQRADLPRYARHYAADFESEGLDLDRWLDRKAGLADRHRERRVAFDSLLVLRDGDRLWVGFRQEYASGGHRDVGRKVLALRRDGGQPPWRIVSESWRPLEAEFELIEELPPIAAASPRPAPATPPAPALPPEPAAQAAPEPPAPSAAPAPVAQPEPATPSPEAAPQARGAPVRRAATARLLPATVDRGTFTLLGPYARLQAGSAVVEVQLLNQRAALSREVEVLLLADVPGAGRASLPEGAASEQARGERSTIKQGRLLALELPLPGTDASVTVPVLVIVRDDRGAEALRQVVSVELPPR